MNYRSNIRTAVAALLAEHPAAIAPILAAIGDALEHHDPRRDRTEDDDKAAA